VGREDNDGTGPHAVNDLVADGAQPGVGGVLGVEHLGYFPVDTCNLSTSVCG